MCFNGASERNVAVVCQELGYKEAGTVRERPRNTKIHYHLLWYTVFCSANEGSVFDCPKCFGPFYVPRRFPCQDIPEYTCQSKFGYEFHN